MHSQAAPVGKAEREVPVLQRLVEREIVAVVIVSRHIAVVNVLGVWVRSEQQAGASKNQRQVRAPAPASRRVAARSMSRQRCLGAGLRPHSTHDEELN